jgi:hypothetical protein
VQFNLERIVSTRPALLNHHLPSPIAENGTIYHFQYLRLGFSSPTINKAQIL